MNKIKNEVSGLTIIIIFALMQIVMAILSVFVGITLEIMSGTSKVDLETSITVAQAIVYGIATIVLCVKYKKSIYNAVAKIKSQPKNFIVKLVIYGCITAAVLAISMYADKIFFSQFAENSGANEEAIDQAVSGGSYLFTMFLGIGIFAPIVEEVVFRYALIGKLMYRVNKYVAATIGTLIFAFIHIGFDQVSTSSVDFIIHLALLYVPMSAVFSFIYAREEDLTIPLIIHILNNSIAMAASILLQV